MKIIIAESYEAMSQQAADEVVRLMKSFERPLICTASGDSPAGLYKQLLQKVDSGEASVADWFFISLDEWGGMNGADEGSCRYYLNKQLFGPLKVKEERIFFFDGRADLEVESDNAEQFIQTHGGIDVAIVGLGINGHIGMNEPGTPVSLGTHVADIAAITQQVGQKYFKEQRALTRGVTLGLSTIMKARHVILVVSGKHKAEIMRQVFEGRITEGIPASLLRNHPQCVAFLDTGAASLLSHE